MKPATSTSAPKRNTPTAAEIKSHITNKRQRAAAAPAKSASANGNENQRGSVMKVASNGENTVSVVTNNGGANSKRSASPSKHLSEQENEAKASTVDDTNMLVFRGGKWIPAPASEMKDVVRFHDIKYFYANIIDYVRVIMCLIAGYTITTDYHMLSAFLIIGSTLLDWIDGPVARWAHQCCIMGSGWDWLADMLCQMLQVAWWVRFDNSVMPWLFACTAVELCNCIFDFATTATCKYPNLAPKQTGFFWILEISLGANNYNSFFYTAQWLAYPIYCVLMTLELAYQTPASWASPLAILFLVNRWVIAPMAFLYIWCETAYCAHIIRSWTEPSRKVKPDTVYDDTNESMIGGFVNYGPVDTKIQHMLRASQKALSIVPALREAHEASKAKREIFWVNFWQRSGGGPRLNLPNVDGDAMEKWVQDTVRHCFGADERDGAGPEGLPALDGYGFIINPVGSKTQPWHVDYTNDYATIFIPLTTLTPENATQYVIVPHSTPKAVLDCALSDMDNVDLNVLMAEGSGYAVRQNIAQTFSMLRMDYGTIHRGIANLGNEDRVVFWISVKRYPELLPEEPLVQIIDRAKSQVF